MAKGLCHTDFLAGGVIGEAEWVVEHSDLQCTLKLPQMRYKMPQ